MKELFIYDFGSYWGNIFFGWFWNLLAWLGIITLLREIYFWLLMLVTPKGVDPKKDMQELRNKMLRRNYER